MYLPWKKMMFCRVEKTAFGECLCVHIFSKDKVSFRILQVLSGLMPPFSFSFLSCVFILSLSAYFPVPYLFSTFSFLIFVCL